MPFRIGLSGLNAAQADLKITGNNIANVGTIGFKQSRAEFADVYASSKFGSVSTAIGSGVRLAAAAQQFTQGNIIFTENNLDLGITGEGFFSMADVSGNQVYTRNGQFKTDKEGFIVDNSGSNLKGYGIDPVTNNINTGSIVNLQIIATNIAPEPSSEATIIANINSGELVPTLPFSVNSKGTADPNSYNHTTSFTSFDSMGNPMLTSLFYRKTATNIWDVGIKQVDSNGNIFQNMNPSSVQPASGDDPQILYIGSAASTAAGASAGAAIVLAASISPAFPAGEPLVEAAYLNNYVFGHEAAMSAAVAAASDFSATPPGGGEPIALAVYNASAQALSDATLAAAAEDGAVAVQSAAVAAGAGGTSVHDDYVTGYLSGGHSSAMNAAIAAADTLDGATAPNGPIATAVTNATASAINKIEFLNNGTINETSVGTGNGQFNLNFNLSAPSNPVMTDNGGPLIAQSITIAFNGLTQYGANFGVTNLTQNGYTTGQLSGIDVDQSGVISARFTNGQSNNLGQVFLTSFTNTQGLSQLGDNYWAESFSSGQGIINAPGEGNAGLINSGALEDSNVDLTEQLINLITAQRNFQANAKTITTADTITQTVIQL